MKGKRVVRNASIVSMALCLLASTTHAASAVNVTILKVALRGFVWVN